MYYFSHGILKIGGVFMDKINLKIITSSSFNPWFNLALEEYLYDTIEENTVILYLWQNKNTVVIGKSQNAWKECRIAALETDGGKLARRPSGGGAVYHDAGNMCYTFIASSGLYNLEKQLSVILEAVRSHGISAQFTGRNDIVTSEGRKFSGNAFRFSGEKGLMHGTLLLDTDAEKMSKYLQVSPAKMKAKGVDSVRSRVINLIELNKDITPLSVKNALKEAFRAEYGNISTETAYSEENFPSEVAVLYEKYSSWQWRMGETPQFDVSYETRFSWGCFELTFTADRGYINQLEIFTDSMDPELADKIKNSLAGSRLSYDEICLKLSHTLADTPEISNDLTDWLKEIL